MTFILLDYINHPEWLTIICKDYGIIGIQIDQDISYTEDRTKVNHIVILISSNDTLWVRINILLQLSFHRHNTNATID